MAELLAAIDPRAALGVHVVLAVVGVALAMDVAALLRERRAERVADVAYESGGVPVVPQQRPLHAPYFLIAALFVIFEMGAAILIAWAVVAREAASPGLIGATVFIVVLLAALACLWAIDATARRHRDGQPSAGIMLASQLISLERDADIRRTLALPADASDAPSIATVYRNADWYEREAFDLMGVRFQGRPDIRRILLPPGWQGHPLRKDQPVRATEGPVFRMTPELFAAEEKALAVEPEAAGLPVERDSTELMVRHDGPHHPATHGVFRIVLALDGEEIVAAWPDIGYHHRGAEKIAERQTWHAYIP